MPDDSSNPELAELELEVCDEVGTDTPPINSPMGVSAGVVHQLMEHAVRRATYRDKKRIYELEQKVADAEKMRCPYPGVVHMKKQLDDKERQCRGLQETLFQKQSEIDRLNRLVFQLQSQVKYHESTIRIMQGTNSNQTE